MKNIVFGVTGGIAAYKACDLVNAFRKKDYNVDCIMTENAQKFITPMSLEVISNNRVVTDMFERPEKMDTQHISYAKKADVVVVAPASANFIAKMANGICDDMLTTTVISTKAPVVIAPAMNNNMYDHPITQENIKKLKEIGYIFIGPIEGRLICGDTAKGHLADIHDIFDEVQKTLGT